MTPDDKPLMKICFYAALNGGSVANRQALMRHLGKTIKKGHYLYDRLEPFIHSFLGHPLAAELKQVGAF
jgi:hypothetical protein